MSDEEKKAEKSKKEKKSFKLFKIKNPKKAGIIAFVTMLVISSLFVGGILTVVAFNYLSFNQKVEEKDQDNGGDIVVTQEESSIINVVENARDSVVSIAVTQLSFSSEQGIVDQSSNIGTGFIVDSNGIIVTNQHVVSNLEAEYKVITTAGDEYNVVEIERDNTNDIA